jgi:hypothetical protein
LQLLRWGVVAGLSAEPRRCVAELFVRWRRALNGEEFFMHLSTFLDDKRKVEIGLNGPNLLWGMDILKGRASRPPRGTETVPSDDEHLLPSQS